MNYLGLVTFLVAYFVLNFFIVDKRGIWLIPLLFTLPIFDIVFNYKNVNDINGLIVLICYFMILVSICSMKGIKIWNTKERTIYILPFLIIYMFVCALSYYIVINSSLNDFISSLKYINSIYTKNVLILSVLLVTSLVFALPIYNFIDKSIGKKSPLVIIQCRYFSTNLFFGTIFSRYYLEGIHNGVYHRFEITKRMYLILNKERSLELSVKSGILGGKYVFKNPCPELEHKALKRDRKVKICSTIFFILALCGGIYIFIL